MCVHIRPVCSVPEIRSGLALYRTVFGLTEQDPAPSTRLLRSLGANGGLLLGAFRGAELVGFSYGFVGQSPRTTEFFYYMELLVVRPDLQNSGIGRQLMQHLGGEVAARGLRSVRWAFDPLRVVSGHFYLSVIGARGRWFIPNYYGLEHFGRDCGRPTDRVIAEWAPAESPVQWPTPPATLPLGVPVPQGASQVLLAVPSDVGPRYPGQRRLYGVLRRLLVQGFDLVGCDLRSSGLAVYRAARPARQPRPAGEPRLARVDFPGE